MARLAVRPMTDLVRSIGVDWLRFAIIMRPTMTPAAAPIAMPFQKLRFTCYIPSLDVHNATSSGI